MNSLEGNPSAGAGLRNELAVPVARTRRLCDPSEIPFETTEDVEPSAGTVGQDRAVSAIGFGVEIGDGGFNISITGPVGSGRRTTARSYLERVAGEQPVPGDWVYVYNFSDPYRPRAISLAAGEGNRLAARMEALINAARSDIPKAFESENYQRRKGHVVTRIQQRQQALYARVQEDARARGFALEVTPSGVATMPVVNGQPVSPEEYERLPDDTRKEFDRQAGEIREHMEQALRQGRKLEKEAIERLRELDRDVALFAVGHLFEEVEQQYEGLPPVLEYLRQVREDIPDHLDDFRGMKQDGQPQVPPEMQAALREERFTRYKVNVLVDNGTARGAPVVEEFNPVYYNLMGRIEYESRMGAVTTDFTQIKAGAIHRANGGYLMLEASDLLTTPAVWDAFKKALQTKEARIENLGEHLSPVPAMTLRPDAIPLQLKVVLIGTPALYYALYGQDDDFRKLFKVKADFGPDMERSEENLAGYAAFLSRHVRDKKLRHFHRSGAARIVEYSSRLVEDQLRLSTRFSDIADLAIEASFWAGKNGHGLVLADDVEAAIEHRQYRSSLVAEYTRRMINDGTIMIDVGGERVGQVNGLSVAEFGDFAFGSPSRITARTAPGNNGVVNIEREIKLSGPIHSKGVLTLSGYLLGMYARDYPLALSATLTFEQLYGGVDGDSASSTELYALLSALSDIPVKQGIAVTGSVNQYGQVQAVGGINQKIEGFFEVCKARGLTGEQGVVLPEANVRSLMLKTEVVLAIEEGKFHIWSVRTIDQGIELLTGVPAGRPSADGSYPEDSVHGRVDARLRKYAQYLRNYTGGTGRNGRMDEGD